MSTFAALNTLNRHKWLFSAYYIFWSVKTKTRATKPSDGRNNNKIFCRNKVVEVVM